MRDTLQEYDGFRVGEAVTITSNDGFNGESGLIESIVPPSPYNPASEWGVAFHVDFGMRRYGRRVIPFRREEIRHIMKRAATS